MIDRFSNLIDSSQSRLFSVIFEITTTELIILNYGSIQRSIMLFGATIIHFGA